MSTYTTIFTNGWSKWMHLFGGDPVVSAGAAVAVLVFAAGMLRLWSTGD